MDNRDSAILEMYEKMDPNKFYIVSWDSGALLAEYSNLEQAKKVCRKIGCFDGLKPLTFVGKQVFIWDIAQVGVVYNPRFNKLEV